MTELEIIGAGVYAVPAVRRSRRILFHMYWLEDGFEKDLKIPFAETIFAILISVTGGLLWPVWRLIWIFRDTGRLIRRIIRWIPRPRQGWLYALMDIPEPVKTKLRQREHEAVLREIEQREQSLKD